MLAHCLGAAARAEDHLDADLAFQVDSLRIWAIGRLKLAVMVIMCPLPHMPSTVVTSAESAIRTPVSDVVILRFSGTTGSRGWPGRLPDRDYAQFIDGCRKPATGGAGAAGTADVTVTAVAPTVLVRCPATGTLTS